MSRQPSQELREQNIKQTVTIADGATDEVSVSVGGTKELWLRGYGYSFAPSTTYQLIVGQNNRPSRTDQEGNISQPMIWAQPMYVNPGGELKLVITNNSGAEQSYTVMFLVLTAEYIPIQSTGGEILTPVSGESEAAPANSTVTVAATSTEVLAANTKRRGVFLQNVSNEDITYTIDGSAAVIGDDPVLEPSAGILLDGVTNTKKQINAICASGSKKIAVVEWAVP